MATDGATSRFAQILTRRVDELDEPLPDTATFPGVSGLLEGTDDAIPSGWEREFVRYVRTEYGDEAIDRLLAATQTSSDIRDVFRAALRVDPDEFERLWLASIARRDRPMRLRELLGWLRPWLRNSTGLIGVAAVTTVYGALFSIILPLGFKWLVDEGITTGDRGRLAQIFVVLLLLFFLNTVAGAFKERSTARLAARAQQRLRAAMFDRLLEADEEFHATRSIGDLSTRFTSDVERLEDVVARFVPGTIATVISLVGSVIVILGLDWRLALTAAALVPLCLVGPAIFGPRTARAAEVEMRSFSDLNDLLVDHGRTRQVTRAFGLEPVARSQFADASNAVADSSVRTRLFGSLIGASIDMSMNLVQLIGFGVGAVLVIDGHLELGSLLAFQGLVGNVAAPVLGFSELIESARRASGVVRRVGEVVGAPVASRGADPIVRATTLELRDASFRYPNGRGIDDVDLRVGRGRTVAVVGASGSGKSTVLSLILGDRAVDTGAVLVDGRSIVELDPAAWRRQLGVVFQDPQLFPGTVADNIRAGRPDATDEEVESAARRAGLRADDALRLGTVVGTAGTGLSGGQRQRVCIARALVREPAFLVLDEPTSALDPESAAEVTTTLASLTGHCGVVLVTHQLPLAAIADEIVVMETGRVVERGTHAELLARHGVYARSYEVAMRPTTTRSDWRTVFPADADDAELTNCPEGAVLFAQGDDSDVAYVVLEGAIDVSVHTAAGEVEVRRLAPGDLVGELGVLQRSPRSATARAAEAALLRKVSLEALLSALEQAGVPPGLGDQLVTMLRDDRRLDAPGRSRTAPRRAV